ncbi:MAG: hypothetical protein JW888_02590 [Pirellulales bacterium]|nr:hypothetical protein [Pirellulales bacterium]
MARSAKLTSIDAVREMAVALTVFGDEALAALDELGINVCRAVEWINVDRKEHWAHEVRRGWEHVSESRVELEKALTYRRVADQTPDCRQEKAMLERAKRRAEMAEETNRSLPQWAHRVEHAAKELTASKNALNDWLHGELPRALSLLKQMTTALEAYAAVHQPARRTTASVAPAGDPDSAADTSEEKKNDDENLGSAQPGRETAPGDEGPASR